MDTIGIPGIERLALPDSQYYQENTPKTQVCLHHTASGRGADGDFRWWLSDPKRIATHFIVDFEGSIYQCLPSYHWAHHLGLKTSVFEAHGIDPIFRQSRYSGKLYKANNEILNQGAIGIEIDAWGGLKWERGQWRSYTGKMVPMERVIKYPAGYRGYFAFERYTEAQLDAVELLLLQFYDDYCIPLDYNGGMWDVSKEALSGKPGIWTHTSYRSDKSDCHPQPELIEMLKNLHTKRNE
jgi:N-acetyl-anhydromuramyl-L-alanine amidase AmpD